jgi:hypothetical protein
MKEQVESELLVTARPHKTQPLISGLTATSSTQTGDIGELGGAPKRVVTIQGTKLAPEAAVKGFNDPLFILEPSLLLFAVAVVGTAVWTRAAAIDQSAIAPEVIGRVMI